MITLMAFSLYGEIISNLKPKQKKQPTLEIIDCLRSPLNKTTNLLPYGI